MTTTTGAARPGGDAHRRPLEPSLDSRLQGYRYGVVLLLLIATYVVEVAAPPGGWARLITMVLQTLTLLVAMAASHVSRRTIRITGVVLALFILAAVAALPWGAGSDGLRGSFFLMSAVLVGVAPVVIVRGLLRRPVIDVRTVLGALCVYVLIGMMFAFTYATIGAFQSGAFFAQDAHATISDYLYFSFVTQTTVGYGDLTAAGGPGRAMAVSEALFGQIYLVTVVAVLVGAIGHGSRTRHVEGEPAAPDGDPA